MAIKKLTNANNVFSDDNYGNQIYGLLGNDLIRGNGGNDLLDGGGGADTLYGGTGNDTYVVGSSADRTVELAGQGLDTVKASITWTLAGNIENLTLTASAVKGTGNALANVITGNAANNELYGQDGNDVLDGGAGTDYLSGGIGSDTLKGGTASDILEGGPGADRYEGGEGLDTVSYLQSKTGVALYLWAGHPANTGDAVGDSFSGIESFAGSQFNDILALDFRSSAVIIRGTPFGDLSGYLAGADGNDVLNGSGGRDVLQGGDGADSLNGGNGNDVLLGGFNSDKFYFTGNDQATNNYSGHDTITDFSAGDQILLFETGVGDWNVRLEGANTVFYLGVAATVTVTGKTGLVAGVDYIIFGN